MKLFIYEPGQSPFHNMDAVNKFIWLILVTVIAVLIQTPREAALLLLLVLLTAFALGWLSPLRLMKRLAYVSAVAIWLLVFLSFTSRLPGAEVFRLGPIAATSGSLAYGTTLALRLLTLGTASALFVLTTDPRRMVGEFIKFGHMPYRGAFAIYAALRFLPLLQNEARIIRHAQAVRADPSGAGGILGRFRTAKRLSIPLLAGALRRVQTTAVAMDARGFGAHATRTELDELSRSWMGPAVVFGHGLLLVGVIALRLFGDSGFQAIRAPIGGG